MDSTTLNFQGTQGPAQNTGRYINDDAPVTKNLRKAARISIDDLKSLIIKDYNTAPISATQTATFDPNAYQSEDDMVTDLMAVVSYNNDQIIKDLSNIDFDKENLSTESPTPFGYNFDIGEDICGFHTLANGLTFCGCVAAGDWELPLFYMIYYDGSSLRGYIPARGNMINCDTLTAFGSEINLSNPNAPYNLPQLYTEYQNRGYLTPATATLDDFIENSSPAILSYMSQYGGMMPDTAGFNWNAILDEIILAIEVA